MSTILSRQMSAREKDAASAMDLKNIFQGLTGDSLTDHGASLLSDQYYARLGYVVSSINVHTLLVKKKMKKHKDKYGWEQDGHHDASYHDTVLRQFVRVREVKMVEHFSHSQYNNGINPPLLCLLCSYGYFHRFGITCRHVYAVLAPQNDHAANPPSADDAVVSWRKDYRHYHTREKLTALYDTARDTEAPGTFASKEDINRLWPLTGHSSQLQCSKKLMILIGSKWNLHDNLSMIEDSIIPISRSVRALMTDAQQKDDSELLPGGCSQEMCTTAAVQVDLTQESPVVHEGRNVYSSNFPLFTQVANLAEGNSSMGLELRRGFENILFKFIQQKISVKFETKNKELIIQFVFLYQNGSDEIRMNQEQG